MGRRCGPQIRGGGELEGTVAEVGRNDQRCSETTPWCGECGECGRAGGRAPCPSPLAACFLSFYSLCRVTAIITKSIHGLDALGAEEMKRSLAIWRDGAFCLPRGAPRLCPPWLRFEVRNPITRHRRFPEVGRPPLPSVLGRSIPGLTGKDSSFPLCLHLRPGRRVSLPLRPWAGLGSVTGALRPRHLSTVWEGGSRLGDKVPQGLPPWLGTLGDHSDQPTGIEGGPLRRVSLCAPRWACVPRAHLGS